MPGRKESFTRLYDSTKHSGATVVGLPFKYPTVVVPGSRQGRPEKDNVRPNIVDVRLSASFILYVPSAPFTRDLASHIKARRVLRLGQAINANTYAHTIAAISNPSEMAISPL